MRRQKLLAPIPSEGKPEFLARVDRLQRYSGTKDESELAHCTIDATTDLGWRRSSGAYHGRPGQTPAGAAPAEPRAVLALFLRRYGPKFIRSRGRRAGPCQR